MGPEPGVGVRSEEDLKYTLIPLTLVTVLNPPSLTDCSWVSNNAPPFVVTGTFFSYVHWWTKIPEKPDTLRRSFQPFSWMFVNRSQ